MITSKTVSMGSPPTPLPQPPRATPSQPPLPPTVDRSTLLSLQFDIRKFPGDPETISVDGGDIYDPAAKCLSYDLLLAFIRTSWPLSSNNQQVLMNWAFRILDQDALNHCIAQLHKHGRQMHEIVLCDLVDGKLPEAALQIQAGLKKADKSFWQGKLDAAPVKWVLGKVLRLKAHGINREVADEATAEKRHPGCGDRGISDGEHLDIRPNSARRQPAPPESEPPAKRKNCGPVTTSTTGSPGREVSRTIGAPSVTSRINAQPPTSRQNPRRGRRGRGVGALLAEEILDGGSLPVEAEGLQNRVSADAQVGSERVAAGASRRIVKAASCKRRQGNTNGTNSVFGHRRQ